MKMRGLLCTPNWSGSMTWNLMSIHTDITAGEDMIHMAEIFKRVCMPGLLPGGKKECRVQIPGTLFESLPHRN